MIRPLASVDVLVLDFDGVVLDTEQSAGRARRELVVRRGHRLDENLLRDVAGGRDGIDRRREHTHWRGTGLVVESSANLGCFVRHLKRTCVLGRPDPVVRGDGRPIASDPAMHPATVGLTGAPVGQRLAVEDPPTGVSDATAGRNACVGPVDDVRLSVVSHEVDLPVGSLDRLWATAPVGDNEVSCAC